MFAIHRLLALRCERPDVFARGTYTGVSALGSFGDKVVAFERRSGEMAMIVAVPRHTAPLGFPPLGHAWADTHFMPPFLPARWRDIFTGRECGGGMLPLAEIFAELPFAALVAED